MWVFCMGKLDVPSAEKPENIANEINVLKLH